MTLTTIHANTVIRIQAAERAPPFTVLVFRDPAGEAGEEKIDQQEHRQKQRGREADIVDCEVAAPGIARVATAQRQRPPNAVVSRIAKSRQSDATMRLGRASRLVKNEAAKAKKPPAR